MNNKIQKCLYILSLFVKKKQLSRSEITEALKQQFPFDAPLSRPTWERYKTFIENNFSFSFRYNAEQNYYTLSANSEMGQESEAILKLILSSADIVNSAALLTKNADKIYNADIITGFEHIEIMLTAIGQQKSITCTYTSFVGRTVKTRTIIPYFMSSWEGRWYVVAEPTTHPGNLVVYALERMTDITLNEEVAERTIDITLEDYFKDSFGIQHADGTPPQDITIRAFGSTRDYIRARKIHHSQQEIETGDDYSLFTLHLTPCYNFYQQLLWHREGIEVIAPNEVRNEIACIIDKMLEKYKPSSNI